MFFDEDLSDVLKPAIHQDMDGVNSLQDLYIKKKNELGLSNRKIQEMLGMQSSGINPILNGTAKQINLVNFIKIANFLGVNFEELANAYLPNIDKTTIGEIQKARDAGFITETFDVVFLTKGGFFKKNATTNDLKSRITKFFCIKSIYDYDKIAINPVFSRTKRDSNTKMRDFWVRSAYIQFKKINNPNPYDRDKLLSITPKIRPYSRNEENGLVMVFRSLYAIGVTVIYQPCIGKEQVRGATMCVNEKPCIVISNLNKKYPTLWFALMHELYHVLFDFDDIKRMTYHISNGNGDLFLTNEDKADYFAQQYLLSDDKLQFISYYIDASTFVREYAEKWKIHPSIIYSTYCYKHRNCWARYASYIPNMQKSLRMLNTSLFELETLSENAEKIKELLNV